MFFQNSLKKQKKCFFMILLSAALTFLFANSIYAVIVMKGVPQKIGFKDVKFANLNKEVCKGCHGDSLVDRHHNTENASKGNCVFCHSVSKETGKIGVVLERNCMICHEKSPHHQTEAALNNKCSECHDTPGLSAYGANAPSYQPSKVTPTIDSCKNCHVEAKVNEEDVSGIKDTHHGISLKGCNTCHDEKDKNNKDVRICERCHDVKSLHEVAPHVEKDACFGCHGDNFAAAKPEPAPVLAPAPAKDNKKEDKQKK